jgi:hypothetical protein
MVVFTGQWWLDARKTKVEEVAAHLVNLAWNGMSQLDPKPRTSPEAKHRLRGVATAGRASGSTVAWAARLRSATWTRWRNSLQCRRSVT